MDGNGRWARARGLERHEGHRAGVNTYGTSCAGRRAPGRTLSDPIRVLHRKLGTSRGGGRHADGTFLPQYRQRTRRTAPGAGGDPDHRRPHAFFGKGAALSGRSRAADRRGQDPDADTGAQLLLTQRDHPRRTPNRRTGRIGRAGAGGDFEGTISAALDTAPYPNPDLIVRTSGEHRLSNFLLWQGAYSELYFTRRCCGPISAARSSTVRMYAGVPPFRDGESR